MWSGRVRGGRGVTVLHGPRKGLSTFQGITALVPVPFIHLPLRPTTSSFQDPNVESWGTEEEDDGDPPRLWAPNATYPGTAFTRSIGDSGECCVLDLSNAALTHMCISGSVGSGGRALAVCGFRREEGGEGRHARALRTGCCDRSCGADWRIGVFAEADVVLPGCRDTMRLEVPVLLRCVFYCAVCLCTLHIPRWVIDW